MSVPSAKFDGYECSGPRPPVPGGESKPPKMTEGATGPLKWACTLSSLLEDSDGVALFRKFVKQEGGINADRLDFYFACEGLKKQTDPEQTKKLISAIYRFFRKSLKFPENVENLIKAARHNKTHLSANIYDQMQKDVERAINESTYLHFLKSEIYLEYVRNMTSSSAGAGGGVLPTTSASSSSGGSEQLTRSFTLPTLHEDSELSLADAAAVPQMGNRTPANVPIRLTLDALLATQNRRLEIRPSGAFGYPAYPNNCDAFYPVSLQDSEIQSFSSGQTDSDTASISTSKDGRPSYSQRRQNSLENRAMRQNAMTNKELDTTTIIPRTQRMRNNKNYGMKPEELISALIPKLEEIKKKQDSEEIFARKMQETDASMNRAFQAELRDAIREKLPLDDDNDQAILDQHVQRVWSDTPPGTKSPDPVGMRRRGCDINPGFGIPPMVNSEGAVGGSSQMHMRHSRSMPEAGSSRRSLSNKWPSMHTDSGISLFSGDMTMRTEQSSRNLPRTMEMDATTMTTSQLEEARRRLEKDNPEARRSRRYSHHAPGEPSSQHPSTSLSSQSSYQPPKSHDHQTVVVFSFCDEVYPYRTKIPGLQPTLKQFKEYLPKKGNFRFFFKTACDDPENPVIHEEITSDSEILPLFDGKVMGLVKPFE